GGRDRAGPSGRLHHVDAMVSRCDELDRAERDLSAAIRYVVAGQHDGRDVLHTADGRELSEYLCREHVTSERPALAVRAAAKRVEEASESLPRSGGDVLGRRSARPMDIGGHVHAHVRGPDHVELGTERTSPLDVRGYCA